jgi:hypothetical protein
MLLMLRRLLWSLAPPPLMAGPAVAGCGGAITEGQQGVLRPAL